VENRTKSPSKLAKRRNEIKYPSLCTIFQQPARPEKVVGASIDKDVFQSLLLPEGAVPVNPAPSKETVTHHALGKQKKDNCQDDYKQELF
jgi:hypothetical protein